MANLPNSGTLSLAQIQSHFGGSNPASLSEYYRGGAYVPSTKRTIISDVNDIYSTGNPPTDSYWNRTNGEVKLNGNVIANLSSSGVTGFTKTIGGTKYQYNRGDFQEDFFGNDLYSFDELVYRDDNINASIPTSGRIYISNFYGADNGD